MNNSTLNVMSSDERDIRFYHNCLMIRLMTNLDEIEHCVHEKCFILCNIPVKVRVFKLSSLEK